MKKRINFKEITILNMSDPCNKGDMAILENTLGLLKKYYSNSNISVINVDYSLKEITGLDGFDCLRRILNGRYFGAFFPRIFKSSNRLVDSINGLKYLLLSGWILFWTILLGEKAQMFIMGGYKRSFNAIRNADFIILKGGSYIYSYGGIKGLMFLCRMIFPSILAILLNKKVIALGHSIGPIVGYTERRIARWTLKRFTRIVVREDITYDFLINDLKLKREKLFLLPDIAFWRDKNGYSSEYTLNHILEKENIKLGDSTDLKIGITIRDWDFPLQRDAERLFEKYITSIIESIRYLYSEYNASCFIMPHVQRDLPIGEQVYSRTKSYNTFLLRGDYSPRIMRKIYGEMDLFIGTRIHSNIFAISEGVPTIAIAYQIPKGFGIIGMAGLDKYILNIAKIHTKDLIKRINMVLYNRDQIREGLLKRANEMSRDVELGFCKVIDSIFDLNHRTV